MEARGLGFDRLLRAVLGALDDGNGVASRHGLDGPAAAPAAIVRPESPQTGVVGELACGARRVWRGDWTDWIQECG